MTSWLIILLVAIASLPLVLIFSKKIRHKSFYFFSYAFYTAKPLGILVGPLLLLDEKRSSATDVYLLLNIFHYGIIFLTIWFLILIQSNIKYKWDFSFIQKRINTRVAISSLTILLFSILIIKSDWVFLLDPRKGYQYHREGVGFVWALYILGVGVLYFIYVVLRGLTVRSTLIFAFLFFLTGSKQLILEVFLKSYLLAKRSRIRIKSWQYIIGMVVLISLMLVQFDQIGASEGFLMRVKEYANFHYYASLVFDDYLNGNLNFRYGEIFASSFWGYVPRLLYPDKPYAYGATAVLEMYFPGLAATGHTPSFGPLTTEFVEFGWLAPVAGVFLNLGTIIFLVALIVTSTNNKYSKHMQIGCLAYVLIPGFGFHLPSIFTAIFAFVVLPMFISRTQVKQ